MHCTPPSTAIMIRKVSASICGHSMAVTYHDCHRHRLNHVRGAYSGGTGEDIDVGHLMRVLAKVG